MRHLTRERLEPEHESTPTKAMPIVEPSFRAGVVRIPATSSVEVHRHDDGDELFYVIEGRCRFSNERESFDAEAGEIVFVARGELHALEPLDGTPATVLAVVAPNLDVPPEPA
jgi:quercetin dioxygenase-like cupin family protein